MMNHDESVSAAAVKMLKHLDKRLETLRVKNDEPSVTWDETLVLRAQIAEVKELRRFITAKPVMVPDQSMFID